MKFFVLTIVSFAVCSSATINSNKLEVLESEDYFAQTRSLISNVVNNIQAVALGAGDAVMNITSGIDNKVIEFHEDLTYTFQTINDMLHTAIANVTDKAVTTTLEFSACVLNVRSTAEQALSEAANSATTCADTQLEAIQNQIQSLLIITRDSATSVADIQQKMLDCGTRGGTAALMATGKCLAGVLWEAQLKAATITAHVVFSISRLNLSMLAVPAYFKVCLAPQLPQAAITIAQITDQLARCVV